MAIKYILTSSKSSFGSNFNCYFLPKALVKLKLFRAAQVKNGETKYAFRFEHEVIQTADTRHRYYLQYHYNAWTDDSVSVEFTPEGFLSKVHTVSDDKTGEILGKIGELGKQIAQIIGGIPEFVDRDIAREVLVYQVTFDPFISTELEQVNKELESFKSPNNPSFFPSVEIRLFEEQESSMSAGKPVLHTDSGNGIFCKPMAAAELTFKAGKSAERHYVTLPHPYKVHLVEVERPRYIKYEFSMDFDKGFPKSISITRPSQLMAFVNIPVRVLSSIFSIPSKLLPFNVNLDNTKGAAAAATQQTQQIKTQLDNQAQMIQLQQQLSAMKPENSERGGLSERGGMSERGADSGSRDVVLNPNKKYMGDFE
ncbi:MAG: hypothetical protein K1X92_13215 [Bacteroidia bacterium]|nr:hypothetical protein [Bacteroidia bacterium]